MGRIERRELGGDPRVSVVIPSRDGDRGGNVGRLLSALQAQTLKPGEVVLAVGYSPCGRAHNAGASAALGEILVFLDDDVSLGSGRLLDRMVAALGPEVGIAGASQLLPEDSPPFARSVAGGSSRAQLPVQTDFAVTDMATHAAMAIRKETYRRAGGEPHDTMRADDQVLRARVRALGLKVGVAPLCWVFHPLAPSLRPYLAARFADGEAAAHDARTRPDLIYDTPDAASSARPEVTPRPLRMLRWGGRFLGQCLSFTPVPLGQLAYAAGYLRGWAFPVRLPEPSTEERAA